MSIYKKIHDIAKKVTYVTKDATVGYGNNAYKAVTHDAVLNQIRAHLMDAGVITYTSQVQKGQSIDGITKSGTAKIRFEALYDVTYRDIESDTFLTVRVEGHAEDTTDKAANKAITYATKAAHLKVFMLETGESETDQQTKNTISDRQAVMLQKLVTETNSDEAAFFKHYGIEKYIEMTEDNFTRAKAQLEAKAKKQRMEKKDEQSN